jgi:predicted nucleic acid-binding protein
MAVGNGTPGTNYMNAVDANVLVYAFDEDEPIKQAKANELLGRLSEDRSETLIPWQAAAEFLAVLRKWQVAGHLKAEDVEKAFRIVSDMFPLRLPKARVFKTSFDLRTRFSLSHWDSMLLAACKDAGVDRLYSEDMDAGTNYDGVTIVNPFA